MKKVKVNGVSQELYFKTRDEAEKSEGTAYADIAAMCRPICSILKIECPDIAFNEGLIHKIDPDTGEESYDSGETFHMDEHPELENNLMMIALEGDDDPIEILSVVSHELRHIHQRKYLPELGRNGHAKNGREALYHPEEIDADGFAIAYLVAHGLDFETAGIITCPNEKANFPRAYEMRMEKAEAIYRESFENRDVPKETFLMKLKNLFASLI